MRAGDTQRDVRARRISVLHSSEVGARGTMREQICHERCFESPFIPAVLLLEEADARLVPGLHWPAQTIPSFASLLALLHESRVSRAALMKNVSFQSSRAAAAPALVRHPPLSVPFV